MKSICSNGTAKFVTQVLAFLVAAGMLWNKVDNLECGLERLERRLESRINRVETLFMGGAMWRPRPAPGTADN